MTWIKIKKLFTDIHLWLGLVGGIVIFVVCLSGTIYTFSSDIQKMLEPELYTTNHSAGKPILPPETLMIKVAEKSGSKVMSITIPEDAESLYSVSVANPEGKGRPITYQIDPYTGDIKGIQGKGKGSEFFFSMFKLHRWLLMDEKVGRPIVGVATILFLFGCISGVIIWFPQKIRYWKQGLKLKFNGNWKRLNHDLHNSLGFYAVLFLLVMSVTGLCWSFEWYKDGLSKVIGAPIFGGRNDAPSTVNIEEGQALSTTQLIAIGHQQLSYAGNLRVSFPKAKDGVVSFTKNRNGFFAPSWSDKVEVNPYNGSVIKAELFADKTFGQKIAASIKPLHTGEILGTFSKIIYFLACLIATSLPITGVLIWWNKLKKKKTKHPKNQNRNKYSNTAMNEHKVEPTLSIQE